MKTSKKAFYRGIAAMAVLAVASLPLAASAVTSPTTIQATVGSTISVSSGPTVSMNLAPGGTAVVSSASDTVSVSTNNTAGYTLTLADTDADTSLVSGANSIAAHTGTHAAPTALANNTWGYAVAGGAFDATYTALTNDTSTTSKWAGVPASSSPVTLKTTSTTASADTTTVWYGVKVNASQPTGTYSDQVTYTATTN